jgi:hypothetical protein
MEQPDRRLDLERGARDGAPGRAQRLCGRRQPDVFGDAQATDAAGLDLRFLQRHAKSPLLAIVHELHPPTYFFIGDDSADLHFDAAQLPAGWMRARNGCISAASAWRANRWRASWWRWRRNSRLLA